MNESSPKLGDSLTVEEQQDFRRLEGIVEGGLETFLKVGRALREIRDRKLYRADYDTFHAYCRERWGFGRHYAYRQIRASSTVELLSNVASWQRQERLPRNEAQARPLGPLDPEDQVESWRLALELADDGHPTADVVREAVDRVSGNGDESVHFSSEADEWLTPPEILEPVVGVLGEIDLDPCSDGEPDPNVPAAHHFTQSEDGLRQEWFGRVFMNPPYGRALSDWVERLIEEFEEGAVEEAVALTPARTDTAWFRKLRPYPRCFLHGRLKFSGHENAAPFPSMTVYLGDRVGRFAEHFGELGDIYVAVEGADGWPG